MPTAARPLAVLLACAWALIAGCDEPPADASGRAVAPRSPERAGDRISPERAGERVAEILALDDPLARAGELGHLLARLDGEALPAVREAFSMASIDRGDTELVLFVTWWAGFDPEGARDWSTRDWTAAHLSVLAAVYRTWARSDPRAAWQASQGLLTDLQRELAQDAVIVGWYQSGAPGLEDFVKELPAGETRQRAADALARARVVEMGAARTLEWSEEIADPGFRQLMIARAVGAASWAEPERVASWVEPQIDGRFRSNGLARRVGTRWVRSEPEAAMAWLASLPEGGERRDGVLESYRDWLMIRRDEAVDWIERQPREPWLEPALALYARAHLGPEDPEGAMELVSEFRDADLRGTTLTYLARAWLQRDYDAADAWLQQAPLPPGVVKRAYMLPARAQRERLQARPAERLAETAANGTEGAGSD